MERKKRGKWVINEAAELFDLPGDVVAGMSHVEVLGSGQLYMENHRGILSYSDREIAVSGPDLVVKVTGSGLVLVSMTGYALRIKGEIERVEWVK